MKKLLVFLSIFYAYQATAANLTDTVGAECGSIIMKSDNDRLAKLEKCLKIYKDLGGSYDELNKRFYRAKVLFDLDMHEFSEYSSANKTSDMNVLINTSVTDFFNNMMLSSYELYNKHKNMLNDFKEDEKDTPVYKTTVIKYNFVQDWYEVDKQIEKDKENYNKNDKGFFNWLK